MTSTEQFTTSLTEMATVQHILDSGATHEEYLSGLREAAGELEMSIDSDDTELGEEDADRLLAYFQEQYLGE